MIHVSPAPVEIGCFDVEEASILAHEIRDGEYPFKQTELSGRFVLVEGCDEADALERIGLFTHTADEPDMIRTRVYAQDFSEIDVATFPGLSWHVDSEGVSLAESKMFDFYFGFSIHPTQAFMGRLDLTEPYNYLNSVSGMGIEGLPKHVPTIIKLAKELINESIFTAEVSGDGCIAELVEGVQYRIPAGGVHRMQPFDQDRVYPARLCIEQYLKPTRQ